MKTMTALAQECTFVGTIYFEIIYKRVANTLYNFLIYTSLSSELKVLKTEERTVFST